MSVVEILNVEHVRPRSQRVIGCYLDRPAPGDTSETYAFDVAGWVVDRESSVQSVELVADGRPVRTIPLSVPRPDVTMRFADASARVECGFHALVGVVGLDAEFNVDVFALHGDQTRTPLFRFRGRHQPVHADVCPGLQPLIVTSLGRTGSTWLMHLLAEHPRIVTARMYPFEARAGRYWMQVLQVLAEPSNALQSSNPDGTSPNPWWVGHHPFYRPPFVDDPGVNRWFGRSYVEQVAGFCLRSTDGFYRKVAQSQGKSDPAYFAEKHQPDRSPGLLRELYPAAREVLLIRDFRDMVCSIQAFNARRGTSDFGRALVKSEEEYLSLVGQRARDLARHWKSRTDRAHLLRYEDLIARPTDAIGALLDFLELERTLETIAKMIHDASSDANEFQRHGTSADPASSVGRWKVDLDAPMKEAVEREFAEVLGAFGYVVSDSP